MLDWNDLRYFLAVARTGSTLAASKQLKVSQATVSRRVSALEEETGTILFVRRPSGYELTARGEAIVPAAEAVEDSILAFADGLAAESRRVAGTVRLTTVASAADAWIAPALASLRLSHPDVKVELVTSDDILDLARGEAEVAIRFGERPVQETLVAQHLVALEESFYAATEIAQRTGMPECIADLRHYPLVIGLDPMTSVSRWIQERLPDAEIAHRANTISGIIAAVKTGMGAAILPCLVGDNMRGLVRLVPPIAELTSAVWMVTTDNARRQPHVRALIDVVTKQIKESSVRPPVQLTVVRTA